MNPFASDDYLTTEVLTATPQKLQLMLLDGALRNARQTLALWESQQPEAAHRTLSNCQEIVNSLLAGLARAPRTPLVEQMIGVYVFCYRTLLEAHHARSRDKLQEATRILEIERETWRAVCEKLGTKQSFPQMDSNPFAPGASFVA